MFVPNFARIAAPLSCKLQKKRREELELLNKEDLTATKALQENLSSLRILKFHYAVEHFTLDTAACNVQVGCIIYQDHPNTEFRSIDYWLRALIKGKKAYDTTWQECLAFDWFALLLRLYREGTRFSISNDHDFLQWILNLADATWTRKRWHLRLSELDFDDLHCAVVNYKVVDTLSHLPTDGTDSSPLEDDLPVLLIVSCERCMTQTPTCLQRKRI